MRLISISEYDMETMKLAKPIYDGKRRIILEAGNLIHTKYLEHLKDIGISYVFVEDAASKGIAMEELPDLPVWMEAVGVVEEA
ncbi:hypothetical protein [Ferviditalea candida]|uniref:Uncharacterized protein n=1 Tax=Ferviditalea candida TaxID=3108399 RepID=A0ABU5ZKX7_9BACL|nr:hypothetical protein [Paenibacillaceae bacterium T2]